MYATWRGAHWTLAALAEIGYPAGDESLLPMRAQVLDCWLGSPFYMEFESKSSVPKHRKELPRGGWAAEGRFYRVSPDMDISSRFGSTAPVDWGGSGKGRMNEWVTADALYALHAAGRF